MLQFNLCDGVGVDREWMMIELLKLYEKYVRNNPFLMSSLHELKEKELGCWCTPSPCHGDILIKLYLETLAEKSPAEQSGNEKHVAEKKVEKSPTAQSGNEKPVAEKKRKFT